jgi:large subunit ribosomal protein L17
MLSNMAISLILHKRITTTVAKAKALRVFVEPLLTRSKEDTTHNRRLVFSYLKDKKAVAELFRDVATKIGTRPGGYTRILRTESRAGDNADMCFIELVDYNENMLASVKETKTKSTRTRRGAKKKDDTAVVAEKAPKAKKTSPVAEKTEAPEEKVEEPKAETKPEEPASEE